MKEDFAMTKRDSRKLESPKASPLTIQGEGTPKYHRSVTQEDNNSPSNTISSLEILPDVQGLSMSARQKSIMESVHQDQGVQLKFPEPPPSFLIPRCHNLSSSTQTVTTIKGPGETKTITHTQNKYVITKTSSGQGEKNTKSIPPMSLIINNSVNAGSLNSSPDGHHSFPSKSLSAGATPTADISNPLCSIPSGYRSDHNSTLSPPTSGTSSMSSSSERLTPRTARRKFFEDQINTKFIPTPPTLWPNKSASNDNIGSRIHWGSGADTDDGDFISRELENSKPRVINKSLSIEERSLHAVKSKQIQSDDSIDELLEDKPVVKKKKVIHRAQSADSSSVRKSLAKSGITAMSPGAPSTTRAADIFATMKRKLKSLKRSASLVHDDDEASKRVNGEKVKPSSQVMSTSSGSDLSPCEDPVIPPPTPPISSMDKKRLPVV